MLVLCSSFIGGAAYLASRYKNILPRSFPWKWAGLFALALLIGGFAPLGTFERVYLFVVLISAFVVGCHIPKKFMRYALTGVSIFLAVFVTGDALLSGERPYTLAHPNLVAAWAVLMPLGVWTIITVLVTQSRGALIGILPVLVMRFVPRRYRMAAIICGVILFVGAVAIRPGTAFDRVNFWEEGIRFFAARPLMGWGAGSYRTSITEPSAAADLMNAVTGKRTGMHTAHNALITIAAENGLMGLIPFIGFVLKLFPFARRSSDPMKWGVMAFAIQQCFDDQWLDPITSIVLGISLSMLGDRHA